jgi:hypothetical protein
MRKRSGIRYPAGHERPGHDIDDRDRDVDAMQGTPQPLARSRFQIRCANRSESKRAALSSGQTFAFPSARAGGNPDRRSEREWRIAIIRRSDVARKSNGPHEKIDAKTARGSGARRPSSPGASP